LKEFNATLEQRVADEVAERSCAEETLRQAQKMDSIGKLTGGVAHDFNNLLQVVSGNLQLLQKDLAGNLRAERRVANALAGVSRGAKLASQLLAFGRRQALEPKVVNIGRLIFGVEDMLRRTIGEGIEIETIVSGGLWNTFIDPGKLENALLNLTINARDAMNEAGKLTIEIGNAFLDDTYAELHAEIQRGQYVVLAVSDTGSGMTPDVMAQAFEPFFSTKPLGKGTGLGLSMVYGFVKQSGGHVKIYSEVGEGTTVKIYLPRAHKSEDLKTAIAPGAVIGGNETILVAEDEEEVRNTVVEMLSDLGYRVLTAKDAAGALSVIESGVPVDLLFTDVVMPGTLKSPELARKARERLPDIGVLFTSGYTENSIVHGGRLDPGVELISKPYTREALARKVRHVLGNTVQRRNASIADGLREAADRASLPRLGGLRVLLCEDDALIRMTTGDMLQDLGMIVVEAASAGDALALVHEGNTDLIIADIGLPDMPGTELASRLRQTLPGIPILFATGRDEVADLDSFAPAAMVMKPYDEKALGESIERLMFPKG
jgi:CheY-like chemotaxis protein